MARKEYEDLLESTQNLGPIDEMGEDDTENKTRGFPEDSKSEEEVDFIPGIIAGEDLVMDLQEILENWIETMGERYGDEKLQDLLSNPDFKDTVVENFTILITALGTSKPNPKSVAIDDEAKYPKGGRGDSRDKVESKETNEELSPSPADYAEGLVNIDDLRNLKAEIRNIGEDLKEEGFDEVVVKEVVAKAADEALLGLDDEDSPEVEEPAGF